MIKLILRIVINAVAIWAAAFIVDGITLSGGVWGTLVVVVIFGLINAFIKPIVKLFSLPLIAVTLGLFTLLINALLFWVTSWLTTYLQVDGFFPALFGSIVVSLVSWLLSMFLDD